MRRIALVGVGLLAALAVGSYLLTLSSRSGAEARPGTQEEADISGEQQAELSQPAHAPERSEPERTAFTASAIAEHPTETAPQSGAITGLLLVNGHPPGRRVLLRLMADKGGWYMGPGAGEGNNTRIAQTGEFSSEDGSFEFRGLPSGWSGRLRVPDPYQVISQGPADSYRRSVPVAVPEESLVVNVERVSAISGRLLDSRDLTPVVGATVTIAARLVGNTRMGANTETDANGEFFVRSASNVSELRVAARAVGPLLGTFEWSANSVPQDLILGDLLLDVGRRVRLRVVDSQRQPVAGAVIRHVSEDDRLESTTSADGLAVLEPLPITPCTIRVLARGLEYLDVPAPDTEDVLEVQLRAANRLTIQVLSPEGTPLGNIRVRVSADHDLFTMDARYLDPRLFMQVARGGLMGGTMPNGGPFCICITDADGMIDLQSLSPNQPFDLTVEDVLAHSVQRVTVLPMGVQEVRSQTITLVVAPFSFDVLVLDAGGHAIQGATVSLEGDEAGDSKNSSAQGIARFDGLFPGRAQLTVKHKDFTTASMADVELLPGLPPFRVVLTPP